MDVIVKKSKMFGKGVFAQRDFKKGEVVIQYNLVPLTKQEYDDLSPMEKHFVHSHWGIRYLYLVPERYVNHSSNPNTNPDLKNQGDVAIRNIKKGEEITTDATKDDVQ